MEKINPPIALKLLGYMGGCKLGNNVYFLAGGLTHTNKRISEEAFIYNASSNTAEAVENMHEKRYTFPCAYIHPYIYAIGGRQYKSVKASILN
jgi:hypothetical protein